MNMKRLLIGLVSGIGSFFLVWYLFSLVNWMEVLGVKRGIKASQQQLGDFMWQAILQNQHECLDADILEPVDSIFNRLCDSNQVEAANFKLHVVANGEVNAFALPDGHLVVYTGLINAADVPEELAGVLGHELAHSVAGHVMQRVVKEVGVATLLNATAGAGNAEVAKEILQELGSSAFDQAMESEADEMAVEYLIAANINPLPLANLLYRIEAHSATDMPEALNWFSTHPATIDRVNDLVTAIDNRSMGYTPVITDSTWHSLKEACERLSPSVN